MNCSSILLAFGMMAVVFVGEYLASVLLKEGGLRQNGQVFWKLSNCF